MSASRSLATTGRESLLLPHLAPSGYVCEVAGLSVVAMPPAKFDMNVSIGSSLISVVPDGGMTTCGVRLNGSSRPPYANAPDRILVLSDGYELELAGETTEWDLLVEFDERSLGVLATEALDGGAIALPASEDRRDRSTAALARRAIAHLRTPHVEPLYLDGLVMSIMMREIDRSTRTGCEVSVGGTAFRVERAIEYAESHLHEPLSLARLAGAAMMSPTWFAVSFRAHTGRPVYAWVLHRRLERARDMLLQSNESSIAEVAFACGFVSQSHLTTRFGQMYGITPLRWRVGAR